MCYLTAVIATEQAIVDVSIELELNRQYKLGYRFLVYPHGGICRPRCTKYKHLSKDTALCDRVAPFRRHRICEGEYCKWFIDMNRQTKRFRP